MSIVEQCIVRQGRGPHQRGRASSEEGSCETEPAVGERENAAPHQVSELLKYCVPLFPG